VFAVVAMTLLAFIQLNRDKVFGLVSGITPGRLFLTSDLIFRMLIHGVIPIIVLLGIQFSEIVRGFLSWIGIF
jgi:hypothetical protein